MSSLGSNSYRSKWKSYETLGRGAQEREGWGRQLHCFEFDLSIHNDIWISSHIFLVFVLTNKENCGFYSWKGWTLYPKFPRGMDSHFNKPFNQQVQQSEAAVTSTGRWQVQARWYHAFAIWFASRDLSTKKTWRRRQEGTGRPLNMNDFKTLLEKMMKILDILISSWENLNPLKIEIKLM